MQARNIDVACCPELPCAGDSRFAGHVNKSRNSSKHASAYATVKRTWERTWVAKPTGKAK